MCSVDVDLHHLSHHHQGARNVREGDEGCVVLLSLAVSCALAPASNAHRALRWLPREPTQHCSRVSLQQPSARARAFGHSARTNDCCTNACVSQMSCCRALPPHTHRTQLQEHQACSREDASGVLAGRWQHVRARTRGSASARSIARSTARSKEHSGIKLELEWGQTYVRLWCVRCSCCVCLTCKGCCRQIEREEEEQRLLPAGNKDVKAKHPSYSPELAPPGLREIYEEEARVNWTSIGILCVSWVIIAFFSILKGGEGGSVSCFPCSCLSVLMPSPSPLSRSRQHLHLHALARWSRPTRVPVAFGQQEEA